MASLGPHVRPLDTAAAIVVAGDDPWDPEQAISLRGNRWSTDERPTAYLAGDPGVALAEAGRHFVPDDRVQMSSLWRLRVRVERALDLRDVEVGAVLALPSDLAWILDRDRCREVGDRVRAEGIAAMTVPCAAFIDAPERFDVVLFPEAIEGPIGSVLRDAQLAAVLDPRPGDANGNGDGA
jgi:RES domain-containing protein